MKALPTTPNSLLLRTDFSDDAAWIALCEAVQAPSEEGFQAHLDCISDPAYNGLTVEQLVTLAPPGTGPLFAFLADRVAHSHPERPVLVVELDDQSGRTFRVIPSAMWSVENNLSLANLDWNDFADSLDPDGIFRGLSET